MSAHTPGPWRAGPKSAKSTDLGVYDMQGSLIATVHRSGSAVSAKRREHDANTLAAAPELLDALRLTLRALEPDAKDVDKAFAAARAAIQKAEAA